jgi:hypothetical protein
MAANTKLYISEYSHLATDAAGNVIAAGREPAVAEQDVDVDGTSSQSAALNAQTRFVRVHADVACNILFGADPTATVDIKHLEAGVTEFFGVQAGQAIKIAVIAEAT